MQKKEQEFELIVIGGGVGGYPAAIRAGQLGMKVALIEAGDMGGTCLNRGCIPSKALIAHAELLKNIQHASNFGINVESVSFDYSKMVERKDRIVKDLSKNVGLLLKANNVTLFKGFGKFTSPKTIKVLGEDNIELRSEKTIIATGSEPREIPAFSCDGERIHDSTTMLEVKHLPKKLIIIGGGVIGCEFASLYNTFGVEVIILEALNSIIPREAPNIVSTMTNIFKKKGITIRTQVVVESVQPNKKGVVATLAGGEKIEADMALVSVGRVYNSKDIGLDKAGVNVNDDGMIPVNDKMETNVPCIYAVGDICSKWWLAHVASHQGIVAANNAAGRISHMHYNAVPIVIFTDPEIGTVGYTLEKAIEEGFKATIGAFPFQALGKSQTTMETEGFAQVVIDRTTGQLLGAQVIGHNASTLISEMVIAINNEMTVESITDTIHAHPTITEVWLEAALQAVEKPLHIPPKKNKVKANV